MLGLLVAASGLGRGSPRSTLLLGLASRGPVRLGMFGSVRSWPIVLDQEALDPLYHLTRRSGHVRDRRPLLGGNGKTRQDKTRGEYETIRRITHPHIYRLPTLGA